MMNDPSTGCTGAWYKTLSWPSVSYGAGYSNSCGQKCAGEVPNPHASSILHLEVLYLAYNALISSCGHEVPLDCQTCAQHMRYLL
jgi:hypothetical protein